MSTIRPNERKPMHDRVERLIADNVAVVFLASLRLVVAARKWAGKFAPTDMAHSKRWNVAEFRAN